MPPARPEPYAALLTGPTTVANLFGHMGGRQKGMMQIWDIVGFDEVADLQKMPKEIITMMKSSPSMERSVKTVLSRSPPSLFNVGVWSQSARAAGLARVRLARAGRLAPVQLASAATLATFPVSLASAIGIGTVYQCR